MRSMKTTAVLAAAFAWIGLGEARVYGGGLLGTTHFGASAGIVEPGDDVAADLYDDIYLGNAFVNLNIGEGMDLRIQSSYLWAEGEEAGFSIESSRIRAGVDLITFFPMRTNLSIFASGGLFGQYVEAEVEFAGVTSDDDETDFGFSGDLGVELLPSDRTLVRAALVYTSVDGDDGTAFTADAGLWLGKSLLLGVGAAYGFDEGDIAARVLLVIK